MFMDDYIDTTAFWDPNDDEFDPVTTGIILILIGFVIWICI